MTDLEAELDALFQLPPSEMVAARNELVARLKKAGERDAAARVKALKRPAPAAWAINACFFRERALLEAALADVAQVRELQAADGVDRQQLAAAVAAQRASLQTVVDAALRHCAAAGLPTAGAQERRVFATVHGWLGGSGSEVPGRMTEELEPSGFEGLGQLGTPAPLPAATSQPSQPAPLPSRPAKPARKAAEPATAAAPSALELARRAREQAEARVREHKQAATWAATRLAEKREKLSVAEQAVERAKREVEDAARALAERRSRLHEKEEEQTRRHSDVEEAERAQGEADKALAHARGELAKL